MKVKTEATIEVLRPNSIHIWIPSGSPVGILNELETKLKEIEGIWSVRIGDGVPAFLNVQSTRYDLNEVAKKVKVLVSRYI